MSSDQDLTESTSETMLIMAVSSLENPSETWVEGTANSDTGRTTASQMVGSFTFISITFTSSSLLQVESLKGGVGGVDHVCFRIESWSQVEIGRSGRGEVKKADQEETW